MPLHLREAFGGSANLRATAGAARFVVTVTVAVGLSLCGCEPDAGAPGGGAARAAAAASAPIDSKPEGRKRFAEQLEAKYLDAGLDVHVGVWRRGNRVLTITYALLGRPTAWEFSKDADLHVKLRARGFRQVVLSDGYNESYSWDLRSERWSWKIAD